MRGVRANEDERPPTIARAARFGHAITAIVAVIGLLATGVLGAAASVVHERNDHRLLHERAQAAADSLTKVVPSLQSGLESAATLIQATSANRGSFQLLFGGLTGAKGPFSSVSVLDPSAGAHIVIDLGATPQISAQPPVVLAHLVAEAQRSPLAVIPLLHSAVPTVGYAVTSRGRGHHYIVYAETAVPPNRWHASQPNPAFVGLDYAAYLGAGRTTDDVLAASTRHLPLPGHTETATVPYGDTKIHLVVRPTQDLGGRLLLILPWLIFAIGTAISLAFAILTDRLLRRREDAEALAAENAVLYRDQRELAQTLQQGFLPDALPQVTGLELTARYEPGVRGLEIGGDWYDAWLVDDGHLMLVVGDVSGRGLAAARITALLRHGIRAYAEQGDDPSVIAEKVNRLLLTHQDEHFATLLCARVELATRTATIVDAGHPSPILVDATGSRFVETVTGPPVGLFGTTAYQATTVVIPPGATLFAFTDGLFERRREDITVGLERLRQAVDHPEDDLDHLVTRAMTTTPDEGAADDIAVLAVRWAGPRT